MEQVQMPQQSTQMVTMEQLYREYGEATIQLKIIQQKIMILEQSIQQGLNQQPQQVPVAR